MNKIKPIFEVGDIVLPKTLDGSCSVIKSINEKEQCYELEPPFENEYIPFSQQDMLKKANVKRYLTVNKAIELLEKYRDTFSGEDRLETYCHWLGGTDTFHIYDIVHEGGPYCTLYAETFGMNTEEYYPETTTAPETASEEKKDDDCCEKSCEHCKMGSWGYNKIGTYKPEFPNVRCWHHKDCTHIDPYIILEDDWKETAKECENYEPEER